MARAASAAADGQLAPGLSTADALRELARRAALSLVADELRSMLAPIATVHLQLARSTATVIEGKTTRRPSRKPRRRVAVRRARVVRAAVVKPVVAEAVTEASERRATLLALLQKSEHGMNIAELRQRTPTMDPVARQNALTVLKMAGQIRRDGNSWRVA